MSFRTKLVLRILWIVFGFLAIIGGIYLTVCGFNGTLAPIFAGFGWLVATIHILASAVGDLDKLVNALRGPNS